jgi:hypothetical protein
LKYRLLTAPSQLAWLTRLLSVILATTGFIQLDSTSSLIVVSGVSRQMLHMAVPNFRVYLLTPPTS